MKNKFLLIFAFVMLVIALLPSFAKPNFAFADDAAIEIEDVPAVPVYDQTVEFITVKASVVNAPSYNGYDIEWVVNGTIITSTYKITVPAENQNVSELKIHRVEYASMTSRDTWTIRARIKTNHQIFDQVILIFKTSASPLTVVPNGEISKVFSPHMIPFSFTVQGLEDDPVQWYMLANSNKYVKVSNAYSTARTYSFAPEKPGTYAFIAKVGDYYSDPFVVTAQYATITSINFTVSLQNENRNGFNTYLFRITNLDSTHDIDNINWYIVGYTTPVQYGGTTFVFQPSSYGTYRIRAQYGTSQNAPSDEHTIDVKINRTKEILIGAGIAVAIMGIGLIITIVRNVKNEKIW